MYRDGIRDIDGLRLVEPVNVSRSNFQYVVVDVDEADFGLSRDLLLKALRAENVVARRYFFRRPSQHPVGREKPGGGVAEHGSSMPIRLSVSDRRAGIE